MASTMQAWRTGLSLTKAEMYAKINEFFPDIYDWDSVDTSVSKSNRLPFNGRSIYQSYSRRDIGI
jgi:hypothetical protein